MKLAVLVPNVQLKQEQTHSALLSVERKGTQNSVSIWLNRVDEFTYERGQTGLKKGRIGQINIADEN